MKPIVIAGGAAAVLVGAGFICPAVAELRTNGTLTAMGVMLLFLGIGLTVAGAAGLVRGARLIRA